MSKSLNHTLVMFVLANHDFLASSKLVHNARMKAEFDKVMGRFCDEVVEEAKEAIQRVMNSPNVGNTIQ